MGKVFASADWHGCWDPAYKVLDYLQPDDTLYFLGDAIDRGDRGFDLFNILYKDPRIKILKGNHEEMMEIALKEYISELYAYEEEKYDFLYNSDWFYNGGEKTWENGLKNKTNIELKQIINDLEHLAIEYKYQSPIGHTVILEHAGYSPFSIPRKHHDPLWDREHFCDDWNEGWGIDNLNPNNIYLVHGHTPVQYLKFMFDYNGKQPLTKEEIKQKEEWLHSHKMSFDWKPIILRYCDKHKFCVDMCTVVSDRIALLNLDTFEILYFDVN